VFPALKCLTLGSKESNSSLFEPLAVGCKPDLASMLWDRADLEIALFLAVNVC